MTKLATLSIRHKTYVWTPEEDALLYEHWDDPAISLADLAWHLGCCTGTVSLRGRKLGLGYKVVWHRRPMDWQPLPAPDHSPEDPTPHVPGSVQKLAILSARA